MAYQYDAAQLLKSTKSWTNKLLIVRIVKFALGTIAFIVFIAGIIGAVGQINTNPEESRKAIITALLGGTTIGILTTVFWSIISLVYLILLIISPFKLHDLPRRMNLKNVHLVSKFQGIYVLSILAIFVGWINIIYLIMLRSFISKSEKEIIEDCLD